MSMILDKYVLCYIFSFLVGPLVLILSLLLWRREKHGGGDVNDPVDVNQVTGDEWSEKVAGSADDIIIVGAGVAGSALAYTLGKVTKISPI